MPNEVSYGLFREVKAGYWRDGQWVVVAPPLMWLLRHGGILYERTDDFGFGNLTGKVRAGKFKAWLPELRENGGEIDVSRNCFLLTGYPTILAVGDGLLADLRERCELDECFVFQIPPQCIHWYRWNYSFHRREDKDDLYDQLLRAIRSKRTVSLDVGVLQKLSARFPGSKDRPAVWGIMLPWIRDIKSVHVVQDADVVRMSCRSDIRFDGARGERMLCREDFVRRRLLRLSTSLLLPKDAADLLVDPHDTVPVVESVGVRVAFE